MYIRYNTYTIPDYIIMLVRLFDPKIQELVPYGHTTEGGVDCFDVLLPERFLNMTDSDGRYVGPLTTAQDSHLFDVQVKDSWGYKQGHTVKHEVDTQTIPADDADERFDVTNVHNAWDAPKMYGSPLKIYLKRHTLPPRPLEEHYWTFYRDKEIVAKLTLRTAIVQKYNAAKEQLDANLREQMREEQETSRARNAAKQQEADDLLERQRQFNERVRAANGVKELEAANLRERRQREFNELQEKVRARDAAKEQERQRANEAVLEGMRAKPAPSGEPAAKRQRCLNKSASGPFSLLKKSASGTSLWLWCDKCKQRFSDDRHGFGELCANCDEELRIGIASGLYKRRPKNTIGRFKFK